MIQLKNWTAYHWDCLEIMDMLIEQWIKVDAIITDPPYWMKYVSNRRKIKYNKIIWDDNTNMQEFFDKSYNIMKNNSHIYVFCNEYCIGDFRNQLLKSWFSVKRMLVRIKNNHTSGDLLGDYANQTEYILFAHKWRKILNWKRNRNCLNFNRVNTNIHPTAKPVDMFEFIIQKSSEQWNTILDPFAWSFTTAVACENTKRKRICIEKDDNYFNIWLERLKNNLN